MSKKPVPLNQRIRSDIEQRILRGEWPPGYRIPFEHELMAEYGCSRMTVNRALTMLVETGMIVRRRKSGSFVRGPNPQIESIALEIPDIPVDVEQRGHAYRFSLISRRHRAHRRMHAHEPALADIDGRVLELRSLHLADERPFALEMRLINPEAAPAALEMDFSATAPGSWLLRHVPWTRAQHRISAINADEAQAAQLQVAAGTACLVIERQTWRGDQCVTFVRQVFLGEHYDLVAGFAPPAR
ncbi:MAG: histidine utilization repressor [Gammaproteobacteria bacterium]|nr:histidine utilization repressor [Gammaproteobacteria bacterium]